MRYINKLINRCFWMIFIMGLITTWGFGATPQGENLEYKVLSINAPSWIVTAQEVESGDIVKFRLPPSVFKGQTFDANLNTVKRGHQFSVRGPRNARLNQLIMEKPLKRTGSLRAKGRLAKPFLSAGKALGWEILNVNPKKWIVTAKNRDNNRIIKFQVNPECFNGFKFRANLRGIGKGKGFAIITPNQSPLTACCTLLE